ncbi:outer membrane beta-barrel family protein [Rhabdobacter roseus]|uniref:Outer membrane receptor protein involved in Fe transport n=1 Tax=Rhabdobacter roseus TaxID=1655419 RepID=A0A840TS46_9BACT|nr:TonB dependent receptor [Rhabdobacter roseus]MBB5287186.1 outer membrane receptor protein involved in Fe transport [Rhabdobacter roseus]
MRKTLLLLLWGALGMGAAWAQNPATLLGRIVDEAQKPLEFASVVLLLPDSSFVKGTVTDTAGTYALPQLTPGTYLLKVSSLGYQTALSTLNLPEGQPQYQVPDLVVAVDAQSLQEVVVRGEKPLIERELGKIIVNVSNSAFFKTAANAVDVLKRAPGLIVDPSGAISVKGLYAPLIMLEGRQQPLTPDELRNIPSSDIERVEISTNASAQYDGEVRAVINIRLKRDKSLGWSGSTYLGGAQNRYLSSYNGGLSLTYKTKRWAHYGLVGYRDDRDFLKMSGARRIGSGANYTLMEPDAFIRYDTRPLTYRLGTDFQINQKHSLGVVWKGVVRQRNDLTENTTTLTRFERSTALSTEKLKTRNENDIQGQTNAINLNYKGKLSDKGNELTVDVDYALYDRTENQSIRNRFLDQSERELRIPGQLRGLGTSDLTIQSVRADYLQPLPNDWVLLAGAKLSRIQSDDALRYDSLRVGTWVYDASKSNRFVYHEDIAAGYVLFGHDWEKLSLEGGLRVERTATQGNSMTMNSAINRQYWRWLPSLQASYQLTDKQSLQASFARKLTRPSFYDLNPFTFYTDPFSYIEGNPFLLPVTRNTAELGYSIGNFNTTLSYVHDSDIIAQMPIQDDETKIIRYTRVNLNTQKVLNWDASYPYQVNKWWRMNNYLLVQHRQIQSAFLTDNFDNKRWTFFFEGGQYFSLSDNCTFELSYYYQGPSADQFYRVKGYGTVSVGIQKSFLSNRINTQVNLNDIFNTYREFFYGQYLNVDLTTLQTRGMQQATVRMTYRFGQSTYRRKQRTNSSAEEESRTR